MSDSLFTKPEKPFLLMFKDVVGQNNYEWFDDENEFKERIRKVKSNPYPCSDIEAIEIGSSREVDCDEIVHDEGWFIESVISAYEDANKQGFDSIVLAIDTDIGKTYYINETVNGLQCDNFDYYFDDLDSIASELFIEIQGNVTEIRIE